MTTSNSNDNNASKRRRVSLVSLSAPPAPSSSASPLDCLAKDDSKRVGSGSTSPKVVIGLNGVLSHEFSATPRAERVQISTRGDFLKFLNEKATFAQETKDQWMCSPNASWVKNIINHVTKKNKPGLDKLHRKLQCDESVDTMAKWFAHSEFVSGLLDLYFENMTLDDVISQARAFGHFEFQSGYVLHGNYIDDYLSVTHEGSFKDDVVPMIKKLSKSKKVSVYQNHPDCALRVLNDANAERQFFYPSDIASMAEKTGVGSLNTTYDFHEFDAMSEVQFIDDLYDEISANLFYDPLAARTSLNPRIYL